jgi:predicted phosphodiesterase
VAGDPIRILSDVHYGDRASRVRRLEQLRPLFGDVSSVVFNGDTLDTRIGPRPAQTAQDSAAVRGFAAAAGVPVTFLTGNHDPDFSDQHALELAHGEVFVVHGDVLFDNIVPWGRDAHEIRTRIRRALGAAPEQQLTKLSLADRLELWRSVARAIPQRHQSERHPLRYATHFLADTIWPPTRFLEIFRAWHQEPRLATDLVRREKPKARYVILGHTHRPAIRQVPGGPVVINTGSFTAPFGGFAVDVATDRLRVRRVDYRGAEFRGGGVVAEFPLANR